MSIIFYPHEDELESSTLEQKLEVLMEASERFKAIVLDVTKVSEFAIPDAKKRVSPRELKHSFNWEELASLLREIRELPESSPSAKVSKAGKLVKLSEIYEVLRGAKMPKLEAVRLALTNEANQLKSGTSQVA